MSILSRISDFATPHLRDQVFPVSFRFAATFFWEHVIPDPIDLRFQKVSGLASSIETEEVREGGENLFAYHLPTRVSYETLVLERGLILGSPLNIGFNVAMSTMQVTPANVLIAPLDKNDLPLNGGWLCINASPKRWSISDLDANENSVVIETLEMNYERLQHLRI